MMYFGLLLRIWQKIAKIILQKLYSFHLYDINFSINNQSRYLFIDDIGINDGDVIYLLIVGIYLVCRLFSLSFIISIL